MASGGSAGGGGGGGVVGGGGSTIVISGNDSGKGNGKSSGKGNGNVNGIGTGNDNDNDNDSGNGNGNGNCKSFKKEPKKVRGGDSIVKKQSSSSQLPPISAPVPQQQHQQHQQSHSIGGPQPHGLQQILPPPHSAVVAGTIGEPPPDVYAVPIRKRSISTHSASERGVQGLLDDLARIDKEEQEKEQKRQMKEQKRAQKALLKQQQQREKKQLHQQEQKLQQETGIVPENEWQQQDGPQSQPDGSNDAFQNSSGFHREQQQQQQKLGFAMERFLSSTPQLMSPERSEDRSAYTTDDVGVTKILSHPPPPHTTLSMNNLLVNTSDPRSGGIPCMGSNEDDDDEDLLSDLIAHDENDGADAGSVQLGDVVIHPVTRSSSFRNKQKKDSGGQHVNDEAQQGQRPQSSNVYVGDGMVIKRTGTNGNNNSSMTMNTAGSNRERLQSFASAVTSHSDYDMEGRPLLESEMDAAEIGHGQPQPPQPTQQQPHLPRNRSGKMGKKTKREKKKVDVVGVRVCGSHAANHSGSHNTAPPDHHQQEQGLQRDAVICLGEGGSGGGMKSPSLLMVDDFDYDKYAQPHHRYSQQQAQALPPPHPLHADQQVMGAANMTARSTGGLQQQQQGQQHMNAPGTVPPPPHQEHYYQHMPPYHPHVTHNAPSAGASEPPFNPQQQHLQEHIFTTPTQQMQQIHQPTYGSTTAAPPTSASFQTPFQQTLAQSSQRHDSGQHQHQHQHQQTPYPNYQQLTTTAVSEREENNSTVPLVVHANNAAGNSNSNATCDGPLLARPSPATSSSATNHLHRQNAQTHHPSLSSSQRTGGNSSHRHSLLRRDSFLSAVESVFSSVRSVSTEDLEADMNDSEKYLASGIFSRAFPERFFALLVTLAVEVPVLLMISGGSDRLCSILGRRRYELIMAFLPLSSAISGNCGLQASTLTTRAVSHLHITKESYLKWLFIEIGASFFLGIGMGVMLGAFAFQASGNDWVFGGTIAIAQFLSIVTAGFTGTMAPLIFTFIFHRDSGKWGGPLETAIQDIVGSFAMVILSYHLLVWFGPSEIDPSDVCGNPCAENASGDAVSSEL